MMNLNDESRSENKTDESKTQGVVTESQTQGSDEIQLEENGTRIMCKKC